MKNKILGSLYNKTILVTGASGGIGKAIAEESAKNGAKVLIHYHQNENGAKKTLEEVNNYSEGDIVSADLTKPDNVKKLFEDIRRKGYVSVDLLVNNAGDAQPGNLDNMQIWDYQFNNIFLSQVHTSNEFIKFNNNDSLRKIVNISSVYGIFEMGNPDYPQYSAAKAAVNSLTLNLAKKYAPKILVNAVAPGYTLTPAWEGTPEEELKNCMNQTKIGRFITSKEIANVVIELLTNDAITGEIIRVDGGLHLLDFE